MLKGFTTSEKSWMMYDWANSAYATVIMAALLPMFFKTMTDAAGIPSHLGNAYWGYGAALASFLAASLAPLLGALGDYRDMKMRLFKRFLAIGILFTAALAFAYQWPLILGFSIVSVIGFSGANLFYDAFLVDVTMEDKMDRVSSYAYALGYIGGSTIPFVVSILLIVFSDSLGINAETATRISFILVSVWWLVFSIPMLRHVKQIHGIHRERAMFKQSLRRLFTTFRHVREYHKIFLFLLAYFFYIDGVGTIIRMAAVYGTTLGIGMEVMLLVLISIQIVAFPCSILYGKLSERFGSSRMIPAGIAVYILICILGFYMSTLLQFWGVAMLVASVQGGLQSISRSHFSKMIPKDSANKFFGIYDIFGKFAAILGPTLFAVISQATGSSRYGVLSIVIQFIIGGTLFLLSQRKVHSESILLLQT